MPHSDNTKPEKPSRWETPERRVSVFRKQFIALLPYPVHYEAIKFVHKVNGLRGQSERERARLGVAF